MRVRNLGVPGKPPLGPETPLCAPKPRRVSAASPAASRPSPPGVPPTHHSARKPLGGPLDFAVGAFAQGLLQLVAVLQVVFVVMPLHTVRLPGFRGRRRGGCTRPRLRRRAWRPRPQVRAGRGRSGPLHVRMQGKPGRRGQDRAQRSRCRGPRREKAGRAQGRPRSIGKAAGSRRGCGWVTGGGGDCTSGAPGAHDPRTAHRPRRAAARRARWRRWQGRRWCSQKGGERGGSERRRGSVMWGAAPPDPSPGGRADWAGAGAGAARGPAPGEGG